MNLLATLLNLHTPEFVRDRVLDELFAATAAGFGCDAPVTTGLPVHAKLAAYARFTREQSDRVVREGKDIEAISTRLRGDAVAIGTRMRGLLGIDGDADTATALRMLYRMIDIDLTATPSGDVTVRRCFFSDYYAPETCRLVSALDEGVIVGLAGEGHLRFSARITEGCEACRARFTRKEMP